MESLLSVIPSLKGSRVRAASHLHHSSAPASSLSLLFCFYIPFSFHASVRQTRAPCSASFCTVSFRSNGVQCGRRSLRDCLHTDGGVFRVSRFVSKPVHRLWNEEEGPRGMDIEEGGKEGEEEAQVHFTRP